MENQFDFLIREMASEQMFKFYEYLDVDTIRVFLNSVSEVKNYEVFSDENVVASYNDGTFYKVSRVNGKLNPHLLHGRRLRNEL
jgi:hypothetical protein